VKPPSDHQVDDDEQFVVHLEHDSLAEPLDADHALSDQVGERRLHGAEEKGCPEAHLLEWLARDASPDCLDVHGDIGQLRHRTDYAGATSMELAMAMAAVPAADGVDGFAMPPR